jgi:hypothetical protein
MPGTFDIGGRFRRGRAIPVRPRSGAGIFTPRRRGVGIECGGENHLHELGHQEIPWGGHVNYASSKGGIKLLMESMAQELG